MDHATFHQFRELVYDHSGIDLTPGKEPLVRGRVSKRMRKLGIADELTYLEHVRRDKSGDELVLLLDAISTNVTHFFREPDHFDTLGRALQKWIAAGQRRFRIWSAACSSGQEPYSIGIAALEAAAQCQAANLDLRILATDISTRVLDIAERGCYSRRDAETIPATLQKRYFTFQGAKDERSLTAVDALRRLIVFRRLNLSKPPFPMQGPLDVAFCRNVMIYFDREVRGRLVAEIERLLKPGGLLLIGHAESLTGLNTGLKAVRPSVYRKDDDS
jgi:chemotaxis protein methyltransferase CheR